MGGTDETEGADAAGASPATVLGEALKAGAGTDEASKCCSTWAVGIRMCLACGSAKQVLANTVNSVILITSSSVISTPSGNCVRRGRRDNRWARNSQDGNDMIIPRRSDWRRQTAWFFS